MEREARKLVKMVYELIISNNEKFKKDYKLRDQLINAAISVMSNIAEGFSRQSNFDNIYRQADKVSQIDSGLIKYLRRKVRKTQ
jgi:four helix bundle protein